MLSIVIPVYNEEESLNELHQQLTAVAGQLGYQLDIIYVDDGSQDGSWDVIQELAGSEISVRGIRFRRNFGKAAALSAGFDAARGDVVFTMDADLQDDPAEIPRFLDKMENGFDVVSGWKQKRHDPWHKVYPSLVFNWLVGKLTGVKLHDHNCGFKSYRREIFHEVRLYGELHRFVPVLAAARGYHVGEIVVNHRPREFGKSKYGLWRIPKGFLDLLTVKFVTGFGQRPQHLLGAAGLISFSLGAVSLGILTSRWIVDRLLAVEQPIHLHQRAIFYYALVALVLGAQFIATGLLAELITSWRNRDDADYSLSERVGDKQAWQTTDALIRQERRPSRLNSPPVRSGTD